MQYKTDPDDIVRALGGVRFSENSWVARCPAHDDRNPSMGISVGDGGKLLVHCYAGCSNNQVWEELKSRGLISAGGEKVETKTNEDKKAPIPTIQPPPSSAPGKPKKAPSARWDYRDESGRYLMAVYRYDHSNGKSVLPARFDGESWISQKPDPAPLYRLDKLAENSSCVVLVVEGERDADAASRLVSNYVVTTSPGGSNAPGRADWRPLKGRQVVIWPDADREYDTKGGKYANLVAKLARKAGAESVRVVDPFAAFDNPQERIDGWGAADAEAEGLTVERVESALETGSPERDDPNHPVRQVIDQAFIDFPDLSSKGQPLNTVANLRALLASYRVTVAYNETTKDVEVKIPGSLYSCNQKNAALAQIYDYCNRHRMPTSLVKDYLVLIADENAYNPVLDWIKSKPWDGVDRFGDLMDTIEVDGDREFTSKLIRRWMLSAVRGVSHGRVKSQGILVLQGQQGCGKTQWLSRLCPDEWFLEGAILDPKDRDSVLQAVGHWIVELGELDATFRKSDISQLKAFLTKDRDLLRRPYDREANNMPRQTVFCASVNEVSFLTDPTGNRRYWVVRVEACDWDHGIDMQQVWAEIMHYYLKGERWWLEGEEEIALQETTMMHVASEPIEERLLDHYPFERMKDPMQGVIEITATEALIRAGYDKPTAAQAKRAGEVIRGVTGQSPRRSHGRFLFKIPAPDSTNG